MYYVKAILSIPIINRLTYNRAYSTINSTNSTKYIMKLIINPFMFLYLPDLNLVKA